MNGHAAALLLCTFVAAPRAQEPALPTLHDAWLTEIMDLDVTAAAAGYRRIADDSRPGNLARWIAAARLIELQRAGATTTASAADADAPPALREVFRAAKAPLAADELLARAKRPPKEILQRAAADGARTPNLRPAVPATEDWLLRQVGPNMRDRMRQRLETIASRGRNEARFQERFYALDIVRAEIQGRTAQADALRTLYFGDWVPPAATGDPAVLLARVRTNLADWLRDSDPSSQQAAVLRELGEAIDQRAAAGEGAALALVQRLPLYAERLLAATGGTPSGR